LNDHGERSRQAVIRVSPSDQLDSPRHFLDRVSRLRPRTQTTCGNFCPINHAEQQELTIVLEKESKAQVSDAGLHNAYYGHLIEVVADPSNDYPADRSSNAIRKRSNSP
jgi:hypothetical protein